MTCSYWYGNRTFSVKKYNSIDEQSFKLWMVNLVKRSCWVGADFKKCPFLLCYKGGIHVTDGSDRTNVCLKSVLLWMRIRVRCVCTSNWDWWYQSYTTTELNLSRELSLFDIIKYLDFLTPPRSYAIRHLYLCVTKRPNPLSPLWRTSFMNDPQSVLIVTRFASEKQISVTSFMNGPYSELFA